jgi:hypothetical protein
VAKIITGFTNGFLYVAEAAAMMTYPQIHERGKYLSIWSAMRNSGSVLGGAVSVATNYKSSGAGSVNLVTYIVFITIESSGPVWALLLSQTKHVRRNDGSKVPMSPNVSWKKEFQALWVHVKHRRVSSLRCDCKAAHVILDLADGVALVLLLLLPCCIQYLPGYSFLGSSTGSLVTLGS